MIEQDAIASVDPICFTVSNDGLVHFVRTNKSAYIAAGHRHRLENPGLIKLLMIEVQSGSYLEEDDIIRFETL